MEENLSRWATPTQDPELKATSQLLEHGRQELSKIIAGQTAFIDQTLVVALCRGHALIEGVPGIAKTLVVKLLAQVLGLEFHRVQSTPDLMPADILGTNVFRSASEAFVLHKGPVFTSFLLVDEINRMPPRTQSALLECMEERQVTIDRTGYALPEAFTVFATQNPIDFEGTYPLPEAQLDRFLMKLRLSYPAAEEERVVLQRHHASTGPKGLESDFAGARGSRSVSRRASRGTQGAGSKPVFTITFWLSSAAPGSGRPSRWERAPERL